MRCGSSIFVLFASRYSVDLICPGELGTFGSFSLFLSLFFSFILKYRFFGRFFSFLTMSLEMDTLIRESEIIFTSIGILNIGRMFSRVLCLCLKVVLDFATVYNGRYCPSFLSLCYFVSFFFLRSSLCSSSLDRGAWPLEAKLWTS